MTLNTSFGHKVSFFKICSCFFNTNNSCIVYRTCKLRNGQPGGQLRRKRAHRVRADRFNNGWGSRRNTSRASGMFLLFIFTISCFTNVFLNYILHTVIRKKGFGPRETWRNPSCSRQFHISESIFGSLGCSRHLQVSL